MPYYIYTLSHPITDTLVYVGITVNLRVRLSAHTHNREGNERKTAWVNDLRKEKLAPTIRVIETVETECEAREREAYWIKHYLNNDIDLFNIRDTPWQKPESNQPDHRYDYAHRRFNPTKFRVMLLKKLIDKGYRSANDFAKRNNFHRNALARALTGVTVPTRETLNNWCTVLECTPSERDAIVAAVYAEEEEEIAA